ncbi:hypothetical protein ACST14_08825 [Aquirufa sp. A-Brett2-15D]
MKRLIFFFLFVSSAAFAQTGIGTTTPNASAKLEIASTNKGLLIPRMTDAQKTSIPTPANGLMIYQTDGLIGFYVNAGTSGTPAWTRVNTNWTRSGNDIAYTAGNISTTGTITGGNSSTSSLSGFAANVASISANYSITAADNGKVIQSTSASAITVSIPTGLPTGFNCTVVQMGAGQITFSGTYLNRTGFTKTASQYSVVSILHLGSNSILVTGEMSN